MTKHTHRPRFPTCIDYSIALLSLLASGAAFAGSANINTEGTESIALRIDDLNLDTARGRASLSARLRLAGRKVCHDDGSISAQWRAAATMQCVRDTVARAMAETARSTARAAGPRNAP